VTLDARTRSGSGFGFLRVSDTGIGIAENELERIFDAFVQSSSDPLTRRAAGVGLGLSISRQLARGMGGDLRVRSTVGAGSVFTVSLPLV
jgi:two-component system sensor histidine kinase EvgS